ncbi:ATP-binding protein [Aliikangiella coralliicola]|nr:ATP-binding protein [Aliikangiella coralliicola]
MKLGMRIKVFSVIALSSLIALLIMLLISYWTFDQGFLTYVNKKEEEQVNYLADTLIEHYLQHNGWSQLERNPREWKEIVEQALPDEMQYFSPRRPRGKGNFRPPPPEHKPRRKRGPNHSHPPPPGGKPPHRPGPPENEQATSENFITRINVLDKNQQRIFGPKLSAEFKLFPMKVESEIIGYIGLKPITQLKNEDALIFSAKQNRAFISAAAISLTLSFIIAYFMAGKIVKPVKKLNKAALDLANGHYEIEVSQNNKDEIGLLANSVNRLAKTLRKNTQTRNKWIADISHELRTPLSVLRGEIEAMIDGVRPLNKQSVLSVEQEVIQLAQLVDDLYELSLSDLGALNYKLAPCDINQIISKSLESFESSFTKNAITVDFSHQSASTMIVADEKRMRQLLTNLLKNTLRYTDSPGTLAIEVHEHAELVKIDIQDSSPGVDKESLPFLFEHLFREDKSRNRATGGAGLGLTICKNIVEAHNGKINAKSSSYGGLWITITLPKS